MTEDSETKLRPLTAIGWLSQPEPDGRFCEHRPEQMLWESPNDRDVRSWPADVIGFARYKVPATEGQGSQTAADQDGNWVAVPMRETRKDGSFLRFFSVYDHTRLNKDLGLEAQPILIHRVLGPNLQIVSKKVAAQRLGLDMPQQDDPGVIGYVEAPAVKPSEPTFPSPEQQETPHQPTMFPYEETTPSAKPRLFALRDTDLVVTDRGQELPAQEWWNSKIELQTPSDKSAVSRYALRAPDTIGRSGI